MTNQERAEAAKLYELLYRGNNIYRKDEQALQRFVGIVNEFKQFLKANENG